MQKVHVLDKKANLEGIAVIGGEKVEVTVNGETKSVAESTFKRWYKVLGEVVEAPAAEEPKQVAVPATVTQTEEGVQITLNLQDVVILGTRGGKCQKVEMQIEVNHNQMLHITEYNGFITDVQVFKMAEDGSDWEVAYKSPKMSMRDTLEWMGYNEEQQKSVRKQLIQIRKAAKEHAAAM